MKNDLNYLPEVGTCKEIIKFVLIEIAIIFEEAFIEILVPYSLCIHTPDELSIYKLTCAS